MTTVKKKTFTSLPFSRFRGSPDFVLPGNFESALLSNIVYRESFSELKLNSHVIKLNYPFPRTLQSLPQPGKENRIILVEPFAIRGRMGVGISSIMEC